MKKYILLLLSLSAAVFASCDDKAEKMLAANKSQINVGPLAVVYDSLVVLSDDIWTIAGTESWCRLSVAEGQGAEKIVIDIDSNRLYVPRTATMTISSPEKTFTVTLDQKAEQLLVTRMCPDTLPVAGGTFTLCRVESQVPPVNNIPKYEWTTPVASWVLSHTGTGTASTGVDIEVVIAANTGTTEIVGQLNVSADFKINENQSNTVTRSLTFVQQAPAAP